MQRIGVWIFVALLLAFAGYLYRAEPEHAAISVDQPEPLARAVPVASFVKGDGQNLLQASGPFDAGQWARYGVTITPHAAAAPDGTNTAYRMVETTASQYHRIEADLNTIAAGQIHTLSLYVKPAERSVMKFEMADTPAGKYGAAYFDLLRKVVTAELRDVTDAGIQELPGGWYRCWVAMPFAGKSGGLNFGLVDQDGRITYDGHSGDGLLIWGAQFEPGSEPRGFVGSKQTATK